jgi:hypothetical protein
LLYKANKLKADFSLQVQNIANVTEYKTVTISANNFSESSYKICARMLLLRATFNL